VPLRRLEAAWMQNSGSWDHKAWAVVGGLLAGLVLSACSPPKTTPTPYGDVLRKEGAMNGREAFEIDLPDDCGLSTDGLRTDFQIFYIRCGTVDYGGIYVGNFAEPSTPRSRTMKTSFAWPSEVQVWSVDVEGDQERADRIAASVHLKPQNATR